MGCKILKRVIWPLPRLFQGRFFFGKVGRAMVSQCTKYEVSRFTRYEAVNVGAKCRKWGVGVFTGHSRSMAMSPFDRAHTTFYSTLKNLYVYLLPFLTYSRLFVERRRLWPTPPAFGALVGGTPVEFRADLWRQKTSVPGLSCVCVILRLAVLVELRLVSDRQTQTQAHG